MTWFALAVTTLLSTPSLPDQDKTPPRNVLFIVADDLRANVLGCYGDKICKSPNIDRLAARGLLFERAYCQGLACGPSRISFLFSRYQGRGPVNLAQFFKAQGWYTARVGKIYHMRVPGDIIAGTHGGDIEESWTERFNCSGQEAHTPGNYACLNQNIFTTELEGRESTGMRHRMFVSVQYEGDGSDQPDHKAATKAIELLGKHRDRPFFLAVGFVRPHYPMVAPKQYFDLYDWQDMILPEQRENDLEDIPKIGRASTQSSSCGLAEFPDNQKRMWAAYYASVTFMDEQVGRILDELERLGLREDTAVVFTSDHGYHLGDHGFWQKFNLHEQATRVPLILSVPGYAAGRSGSLVELVDLYPTLTELAGLEQPEDLQGTSLVPVLTDSRHSVKDGALSLLQKSHSWRTRDWAYLRYKDGSEELYDMRVDPGQFTNLASAPEHAERKQRLTTMLDERLRAMGLVEN
jgi:iduronate 2-sulfatase